jgi:hypothetical protein
VDFERKGRNEFGFNDDPVFFARRISKFSEAMRRSERKIEEFLCRSE